jgi:hypothetical protein
LLTNLIYLTIDFEAEITSSNSFGLVGNDAKVVVASGCLDGEGFRHRSSSSSELFSPSDELDDLARRFFRTFVDLVLI